MDDKNPLFRSRSTGEFALWVMAARSVLVELVHLLGEYWENIVLVGGWVPELLLSTNKSPHIESIDVDLPGGGRDLVVV